MLVRFLHAGLQVSRGFPPETNERIHNEQKQREGKERERDKKKRTRPLQQIVIDFFFEDLSLSIRNMQKRDALADCLHRY
jgi:hypothetical protein